jgi:hypothetical protein
MVGAEAVSKRKAKSSGEPGWQLIGHRERF